MSKFQRLLYRYTQKLSELTNQKKCHVDPRTKLVSFTFDDAPDSAFVNAGKEMALHNLNCTFYVSSIFEEKKSNAKYLWTHEHLKKAFKQNHEIACHTYSHFHAYGGFDFDHISKDLQKNTNELERIVPGLKIENFSYPFGEQNIAVRKAVKNKYNSARGINPGSNVNQIDLFNLKSVQLYEKSNPIEKLEKIIDEFNRTGGWLIFYTHDVKEDYSKYGCSPKYFKEALNMCRSYEFEIDTIKNCLEQITKS